LWTVRTVALVVVALLSSSAHALNKQGARADDDGGAAPTTNLSGYVFAGVFVFNPGYAARPNNTGNTLLRYGLHVDADLFHRWISLSYDLNVFSDRSDGAVSPIAPTEHDHIVGILSTIPLPRSLELTLAVHYENDQPGFEARGRGRARRPDCDGRGLAPSCYPAGYSQSYVDAYARLTWTRGRWLVAAALGGFLWNTSYAARPDNSGLALLRYVLHGEVTLLPWLVYRLDFNVFTDRQDLYVVPTELDLTSEIAVQWKKHALELKLVGEADLPLRAYPGGANPPTQAGIRQEYLALMLQWGFDFGRLRR
jgi:hypothetical protein